MSQLEPILLGMSLLSLFLGFLILVATLLVGMP